MTGEARTDDHRSSTEDTPSARDVLSPEPGPDAGPSGTTFADWVLGLAGLSLLRNWYEDDAAERRNRLIEIAQAYEHNELLRLPVPITEHAATDGYALWADSYDAPGNPMTEIEQPSMTRRAQQHAVPGAVALDAGCGTGRLTAELVALGYQSIGVDVTVEMLAVAERQVPDADFRAGSFERLPVDDDSIDLITTGLAVCHATDLGAVFSEFARVLRPGGRLLMSNPHPFTSSTGGQAFFAHQGAMPFIRNHPHRIGDYVRALLDNGFQLHDIDEIAYDATVTASNPAAGVWPDVVDGAFLGQPFVLIIEAART
ncbi:MAG: class I SAM-dependent methyltransferase [Ilumatobacter sp.]